MTDWIFTAIIIVLFVLGMIGNAMTPGSSGLVMVPIWIIIFAISIFMAGLQIAFWVM